MCVSYFDRLTFSYHNIIVPTKMNKIYFTKHLYCFRRDFVLVSFRYIRQGIKNLILAILFYWEMGILCTSITTSMCTYHLFSQLKYFKRQDTNNVSLHINISVLKQPYDFYYFFCCCFLLTFMLISLKCILLNTHFKMPLR